MTSKWLQIFDEPFIQFHKLRKNKQKTFFGHEYDLIAYNPGGYIEFVVELGDVGDDSKHNPGHKDQLINDGIAKDWVDTRLPLAKFVRINKDDSAHESYLREVFGIV